MIDKNNENKKQNSNAYDVDAIYLAKATSEVFVEIKEVDRKLSYSVVRPSSIICDVGAATGIEAFPLSKAGKLCICLDINKNGLKRGKVLSKRMGIDTKLEYIVASATNMPFNNASFDLVTCFSVLDHLPNKILVYSAVSEFSRVVKNQGYVTITFPNTLFLIGTLSMKLKQLLDSDAFFEQRFTPKEMRDIIISSELNPVSLDSKFPTKVDAYILEHNFPKFVSKIPKNLLKSVFLVAGRILANLEKKEWLKQFGARFGYLSQKNQVCAVNSIHEQNRLIKVI